MFGRSQMIASSKTTDKAQQRWSLIVDRFRDACVQHKQGQVEESQRIIRQELPSLIKYWIKLLPLALREDAKADLRDMFDREQAIVDQGARLQRVFKDTLVNKIIPQLESKIAAKYRAMYLAGYDRRAEKRNSEDRLDAWVNPSYARGGTSTADEQTNTARRRVAIGDISGMIDAIQSDEVTPGSMALADSVTDLDVIVKSLSEAGIDPGLIEA